MVSFSWAKNPKGRLFLEGTNRYFPPDYYLVVKQTWDTFTYLENSTLGYRFG